MICEKKRKEKKKKKKEAWLLRKVDMSLKVILDSRLIYCARQTAAGDFVFLSQGNHPVLTISVVYLLLRERIGGESVLNSGLNLQGVCICGAMEADTFSHQRDPSDRSKHSTAGQKDLGKSGTVPRCSFNPG